MVQIRRRVWAWRTFEVGGSSVDVKVGFRGWGRIVDVSAMIEGSSSPSAVMQRQQCRRGARGALWTTLDSLGTSWCPRR